MKGGGAGVDLSMRGSPGRFPSASFAFYLRFFFCELSLYHFFPPCSGYHTSLTPCASPPRGCARFVRATREYFNQQIRAKFLEDSSKLQMPATEASVFQLEKAARQKLVVSK